MHIVCVHALTHDSRFLTFFYVDAGGKVMATSRALQNAPVFLKASNSTADFVGLAVTHTHTRFALTSPILTLYHCITFHIRNGRYFPS